VPWNVGISKGEERMGVVSLKGFIGSIVEDYGPMKIL
jgi:hypothetical protein